MSNFSATYSPEDNKLRLYSLHRLDAGTYQRVSAAGFRFAPKQDLFVAPMWTPSREDLLLELCGEIGDEDSSLVDRAEERADRFADYSESRAREGDAAYAGVKHITEHIPLGQPILVGHHSERRARRDAERIESGMRRAVSAWDTSEYWTRRAKGALAHAKYKERADVRHRRIKGLEADRRKFQKEIDNSHNQTKLWSRAGLTLDQAKAIAAYDHAYIKEAGQERSMSLYSMLSVEAPDVDQVRQKALAAHARTIAFYGRWVAHVDNRLVYERAMLGESGGIAADKFDIVVGGNVLVRGDWLEVLRVNKVQGRINSLTTKSPHVMGGLSKWKVSIEGVKDYRAPDLAQAAAVAASAKTPPLVNYPGDGITSMTSAEWKNRPDDYKSIRKIAATAEHGAYRVRRALVTSEGYKLQQVHITDAKRVDRPAPANVAPVDVERQIEYPPTIPPVIQSQPQEDDRRARADQLREALREGVQVVSAPQLFATPAPTAGRMADEAEIQPGDRLGEFSAGTGRILSAISEVIDLSEIQVTAVEINASLARALTERYPAARVMCADFMACGEELGQFDKIIINPPFANGQDIAHIMRAFGLLKPRGRLVAICANGPRQNEKLRPLVEARGGLWEELPAETFAESGTNVRTVLLRVDA